MSALPVDEPNSEAMVFGDFTRILVLRAMAVAKRLRTGLHVAGAQIFVDWSVLGLSHPTLAHCASVIVWHPNAGAATAAEKAAANAALDTALHWVTD